MIFSANVKQCPALTKVNNRGKSCVICVLGIADGGHLPYVDSSSRRVKGVRRQHDLTATLQAIRESDQFDLGTLEELCKTLQTNLDADSDSESSSNGLLGPADTVPSSSKSSHQFTYATGME